MHKPIDGKKLPPTTATTDEGCVCPCKTSALEESDEALVLALGGTLLAVHYDLQNGGSPEEK